MFIVLEIQTTDNVSNVLSFTYESKNVAENKYHTILAYAATSEVPIHAAAMLDETGSLINCGCYTHGEEEEDN